MRQRPGSPYTVGNRPIDRIAKSLRRAEHSRFATENMADPGDIEHKIAIGDDVGQHRNEAGIGVPIGKIGEYTSKKCMIDLTHHEGGAE